jgi:hypothetical protein
LLDQITHGLCRRSEDNVAPQQTRRALGSAALAASIIVGAIPATTRNRRNKRNTQEKRSKSGGAREEERCALDANACRGVVFRTFVTPGGCAYSLVCCDRCNAPGLLTCALSGS